MALINHVSWAGDSKTFAWRYPKTNLSTYTILQVAESQEAVLFSKGQIVQKFGPGNYQLNTENIPILRSLFGIPYGGKNPFTAEVWFVNKLQTMNIDWRTDSMKIHDADYNTMIPLVARGRYGLRVDDAERFLIKLVGKAEQFTDRDLTDHYYGELVSRTKSAVMQFMTSNNVGLKNVSGYLGMISDHLRSMMLPFWEGYGFEMIGFYVTDIDVDTADPTGSRIVDAIGRQSAQSIGGYSWQQSQVFETAQSAIDGIAGGGGGVGGVLGAVIASNMMSGLGAAAGGGMLRPEYQQPSFEPRGAKGVQSAGSEPASKQIKEVFCSNCNKKYSATMSFCPHCGDPYLPCPRCGSDNVAEAQRCVNCGTQLHAENQSICAGCNQSVPQGAAFCPACGRPAAEGKCPRCGSAIGKAAFCPACGNKVK